MPDENELPSTPPDPNDWYGLPDDDEDEDEEYDLGESDDEEEV